MILDSFKGLSPLEDKNPVRRISFAALSADDITEQKENESYMGEDNNALSNERIDHEGQPKISFAELSRDYEPTYDLPRLSPDPQEENGTSGTPTKSGRGDRSVLTDRASISSTNEVKVARQLSLSLSPEPHADVSLQEDSVLKDYGVGMNESLPDIEGNDMGNGQDFDDFGPQMGDEDEDARPDFNKGVEELSESESEQEHLQNIRSRQEIADSESDSDDETFKLQKLSKKPKSFTNEELGISKSHRDSSRSHKISRGSKSRSPVSGSSDSEGSDDDTDVKPRQRKRIERPRTKSASEEPENGVRRSNRTRVQPLAYWRNERVVYEASERTGYGPSLPQIREVVRIDSPVQLPKRPRRRVAKPVEADKEDSKIHEEPQVYTTINDYETGRYASKCIAIASSGIKTSEMANAGFRFQKTFEEGEYIACGILDLDREGEKTRKDSKANTLIFVILKGALDITIAGVSFPLRSGGHFIVPRGIS